MTFGAAPFMVSYWSSAWTSHRPSQLNRFCTLINTGHWEPMDTPPLQHTAGVRRICRDPQLPWRHCLLSCRRSSNWKAGKWYLNIVPPPNFLTTIYNIVTNNSPAIPTGSPPSFLFVLNMRLGAQFRSSHS